MPRSLKPDLAAHFADRDEKVWTIYDLIVSASRKFGRVIEDPKKTSIHLVNRSAFAGIQTRKSHLILTLKSAADVPNTRFFRSSQASANRWHLETKIECPTMVDEELIEWIEAAYKISG